MRRNKLLILGAAFTLAITPLVVGCAEVASAMAFKDVKKNAIQEKNGSITFGNTSGIHIKSDSTSVTDTLGNVWTYSITWKNSTYYGTNNSYSVVGSASNPATNITLSHTFSQEITFKSFSATFCANNADGTGTINLKSDGTNVATESFTGTTATSASISSNITGTTLSISIDDITKGIRAYSFSYSYDENIPDEGTYYTVSFDSNGGSDVSSQMISNSGSATASEPTAPAKTGYTFAGWYDDELFQNEYDFDSPVTSDLTLYAKWEKVANTTTYSMSSLVKSTGYRLEGEVTMKTSSGNYYIQSGNNSMQIHDATSFDELKIGNTVNLFGTFDGSKIDNLVYYTVESDDTTNSQTPITSLNDVTSENINKYFEISGIQLSSEFSNREASIKDSSVVLYYFALAHVNNNSFNPSDFHINDYVSVKGVISVFNTKVELVMSSITKMAQFTVTYNSNGGSSVATETVLDGNKATQPSSPTKEPDEDYTYTFAAWYDNEGLNGDPFDFNTPITSNLTLYAKWTANERPAIEAFEKISLQNSLYFAYDKVTERYTDALNRATTGNEETSYTDWADKTATTTVEYSGNSAGGNSSIQLRSSGNSGVIVTSNDDNLKATSITFKFNTNTANSRQIDVYGKHNAYSATSELYSDDKGTLIGSVKKVAPGEGEEQVLEYTLEIDKYYEFIGFRSNDGALWLDSVEISWKEELFDFTKAGIRFNTEVTKSLWGKINEQNSEHPISRYGTFVAKKSDFDVAIDMSQSMDEAIELLDTDVENFYANVEGSATPYSLNETTYKWAAYKPLDVSAANFLTTAYTAVSYVVVNNNYYYTNTKSVSLKDVAADYLENQGYEEDDADGSLYYLANL